MIERKLVAAALWEQIVSVAQGLFAMGQETAERAGLILVDSKYEFGLDADGELMLIDELHTPDSSRYWLAESCDARRAAGLEPEGRDKERVRRWLASRAYHGVGSPPPFDLAEALELAEDYIELFERLTGQTFLPAPYPAEDRLQSLVAQLRRSGA